MILETKRELTYFVLSFIHLRKIKSNLFAWSHV